MQSVLSPLRAPLFRNLWLANMSSNLANMLQAVGAAWLMMAMTASPEMVALVQSCITLPLLALSLIGGALADTLDRRWIMFTAQLFMLSMAMVLTGLVVLDLLTPGLLLLLTLLIGCGGALHIPAWQASLRDVVSRQDLPASVALNSMGFNLMRSVGPALGGLILAVTGAAVLFTAGAVAYLPLIAALWLWRPRTARTTGPREPLASAVLSGLRYSSMSPNLLHVILRGTVFCVGAVSIVALLPVVAAQMLGGGSLLFGGLLGSFGLGAVLAAIVSPTLRDHWTNEKIACAALVTEGLAILLVAHGGSVLTAFAGTFIAGSCWVMANSLFNVIIQLSTPKWVVGRSLSLLHTGLFGGMAIGSWIWGMVAEAQGTEIALSIAALCLIGGAALGLILPLPSIPEGGLDPLNRFREPAPQLDLSRRSGPIGIAIHYHIAPENVAEFLSVMKRRRQIRRRDGAARWVLMRDVEHPELWTETYHVANWANYIRHNERRTEADADVADRLWALHQSADPPVIRRMLEWDAVPETDDAPIRPPAEGTP